MSLPSLYQLRTEYQELAHKLSDLDLDAQTVADTIEASGLTESIAEKAQNIIFVARSFEAHIDAIDGEIQRLTALKKKRQNATAKLHEYLLENMQAAGIDHIDGPLLTLSIRNNPEATDVFEPGLIPAEYMRQPPAPPSAPDKVAIKNALKAGKDVPGARLTRSQKLVVA